MKDTIAPGLETTRNITVDKDRTIGFMGEALRVYGTPDLVRDIENTCRDQVEPMAKGTHARFIVDVAKMTRRLEAKAEKLAG